MSTLKKRCLGTYQSTTLAQSPSSAINNCPTEIWGKIFSLACVDDGFTGRSLSRVSRYIMEASNPYKYQCLAVKDHQLRPLALVFKNLPADKRRVRCLFLAQAGWESTYWRRAEFFITDKNRLLKMIAPTLEKLDIWRMYYRLPLPFQLPALVDLTLHGQIDDSVRTTKLLMCYPALQHLQLGWFPTHIHEATLLSMLHATAPILSTIRLSMCFTTGTTPIFSTMKTTLPIKKIILHPFTTSAHDVLYQAW